MKTKTEIKAWLKNVTANLEETETKRNNAKDNFSFSIFHEEKQMLSTIKDTLESILK